MKDSKFMFEAKTIKRMELLVLSTSQWKMKLVTPLSFFDHIVRRFRLMTNLNWEVLNSCEQLLLSIITGKFSRFDMFFLILQVLC